MAFHDVAFPVGLAVGAEFTTRREDDIVTSRGGIEVRNTALADPIHECTITVPPDQHELRETLIEFHHARRGRVYSFPFKNFAEFKSSAFDQAISNTDQTIGTGDAAETNFQLTKTSESAGPLPYVEDIVRPIVSTVVVALDGVDQPSGWTVARLTGIVNFSVAPGSSVVVSAGFEYDRVMRFKDKELPASFLAEDIIEYSSIGLVGVKGE